MALQEQSPKWSLKIRKSCLADQKIRRGPVPALPWVKADVYADPGNGLTTPASALHPVNFVQYLFWFHAILRVPCTSVQVPPPPLKTSFQQKPTAGKCSSRSI